MADFYPWALKTLDIEGGLLISDTEHDGAANYGISLRLYKANGEDLNNDGVIDLEDLKLLTPEKASILYKSKFWDKVKGDQIHNQKIAEILADMAVNSGHVQATKTFQRQLNKQGFKLADDGIFGSKTLAATNRANVPKLFNDFWDARKAFYHYLAEKNPKQYLRSLKGWLNRLARFPKLETKSLVPTILGAAALFFSIRYIKSRK